MQSSEIEPSADKVASFSGEFHFLSNFHPAPMLYEGIVWPTSEHAYQAMKTNDELQRINVSTLPTPGQAKRYGKSLTVRPDWNNATKLAVMEDILREKFKQNSHLKDMLLATEDLVLEEGNTWGDTFWGICRGVGQNHLGRLLMKIRDELRG